LASKSIKSCKKRVLEKILQESLYDVLLSKNPLSIAYFLPKKYHLIVSKTIPGMAS
jgi:hypothetical protein